MQQRGLVVLVEKGPLVLKVGLMVVEAPLVVEMCRVV